MNKVAKDMSKVYRNTPTIDLLRNRSRKLNQMAKASWMSGYWARKEVMRLAYMIDQIDAELACRAAQQPLF